MMIKGNGVGLRKGRWSQSGQVYLITTVTREREPVFAGLACARLLIRTLQGVSATGNCETLAFVVMPDHLHWLLSLGQPDPLSVVVGRVKAISAHRQGRAIWQAGFHDRAIRRDEDLLAVARYVVTNPLRAGLVPRLGMYPHWDAIWL